MSGVGLNTLDDHDLTTVDARSEAYPPEQTSVWMPFADTGGYVEPGDILRANTVSTRVTLGGRVLLVAETRKSSKPHHKTLWMVKQTHEEAGNNVAKPNRVLGVATGEAVVEDGIMYARVIVSGAATVRRDQLPANADLKIGKIFIVEGADVSLKIMPVSLGTEFKAAVLGFTT